MFRKELLNLYRKDGLYLKNTPNKGRGVFCRDDIRAGETIEVTPVLVYNEKDSGLLKKTLCNNYAYDVTAPSRALCDSLDIEDPKKAGCLPMGVVIFCNHMPQPNAAIRQEEEMKTIFFILTALRDIPKDTEIGVDYGQAWFIGRSF